MIMINLLFIVFSGFSKLFMEITYYFWSYSFSPLGCVDTFVPNKDNVIVKEIVFTQKKKPAAPFDGVTGFFIMLLRSRNHGKTSKQSLEPVGSEINNNF